MRPFSKPAMVLLSLRRYRVLQMLLRTASGVVAMSLAWDLFTMQGAGWSGAIAPLYPLMFMLALLLFLAIPLLALLWIYQLHTELKQWDDRYPIDAWDAFAKFVLPFYNLWGIWHVLSTMARYWQRFDQSRAAGMVLQNLLPIFYSLMVILGVLGQRSPTIASEGLTTPVNLPPELSLSLTLAQAGLLLLLLYVLLQMARAMQDGLEAIADYFNPRLG